MREVSKTHICDDKHSIIPTKRALRELGACKDAEGNGDRIEHRKKDS